MPVPASAPVQGKPRAPEPVDHSPEFNDTESMLGIVMASVLEDSYDRAAAERALAGPPPGPPPDDDGAKPRSRFRFGPGAVIGLALMGVLLTWAIVQTAGQKPEVAAEQKALVRRVGDETTRTDQLSRRKDDLNTAVERLRADRLAGADDALEAELSALGVASGALGVTGPGIIVTVDDAGAEAVPGATADPAGRVLDIDLQYLVNGLWFAGAEAVSVNGQRLTSTTAIRAAGQAITVDYRPVARPYVVRAIGSDKTLQARFVESAGGEWMQNLKSTHDVRFDIAAEKSLFIDGDGTTLLRYATPKALP